MFFESLRRKKSNVYPAKNIVPKFLMISKVTSEANFRIATRPFVLKKENVNTILFRLCRPIKSGVLRLVIVATAKKFLRSRYLSAKQFLWFQASNCKEVLAAFRILAQVCRKKSQFCGRKKKFLRVHYFWAVLYMYM